VDGSFYLLYLAFKTIRGRDLPISLPQKKVSGDRPGKLYRMGFFSNALNPQAPRKTVEGTFW